MRLEVLAAGNLNQKVAPWPTVLSTLILPPCSSTIALAMDSPSPLLTCLNEGTIADCSNLEKMRVSASSGTPGP